MRIRREMREGRAPPSTVTLCLCSGESPNIAAVTVRGKEVFQDFDLVPERSFEITTDAGNRYRVTTITPSGKKNRAWEVTQLFDSGDEVEVGRVSKVFLSGFQFTAADEYLPGGTQGNLWNAVQSLLK